MSTSEKFCLKWNDFPNSISSSFGTLRSETDFTDVTLACEDGQQLEAHKVVLVASSPFFKNLLKRNKHKHPLIYMRGTKYEDLVAIADFLYHGEANMYRENLDGFLALADELKLKGLAGGMNTLNEDITEDQNEDTNPTKEIVKNSETKAKNFENPIYEENKYIIEQQYTENNSANSDQAVAVPTFSVELQELDSKIEFMITSGKEIMSNGKTAESACTVCGEEGKYQNIKDHIELHHIEGVSHLCNFCDKTFRSRHSLTMHKRRNHS